MSDSTSNRQDVPPEVRRGVLSWVAKALGGLVFFGLLLFLTSGHPDWIWAWAFLCLFALASIANVAILVPTNPALLAERARASGPTPRTGTGSSPGWPRACCPWSGVRLIAGLDNRFGWSPAMPLWLHLAGALGFALGWSLLLWATGANPHFEVTVRSLEGKDHTVATGGPYRFVRHPGYVGAILYQLSTPLLLGSWWSLRMPWPSRRPSTCCVRR